ncbi:MAG TPA: hypothetical protein VHO66_09320 [Ruminiclostridium sp.]|nr:hypothetical protein [Ruminiclostridium sp.]
MVKGVTKRIVEIKETGSDYFERAIFFINLEGSKGSSEYTLSQEAQRIIDSLSNDNMPCVSDRKHKTRDRAFSVLKLLISAAAGVFVTLLVTNLF